ncbi:MAG: hypothetical protein ACRDSJ_12255 [Rubrobacteraceae bacterium]
MAIVRPALKLTVETSAPEPPGTSLKKPAEEGSAASRLPTMPETLDDKPQ